MELDPPQDKGIGQRQKVDQPVLGSISSSCRNIGSSGSTRGTAAPVVVFSWEKQGRNPIYSAAGALNHVVGLVAAVFLVVGHTGGR